LPRNKKRSNVIKGRRVVLQSGMPLETGGSAAPTSAEVESVGYWSTLTNGDPAAPELIFLDGDVIMIWTSTP
jgi:hypothetical protein